MVNYLPPIKALVNTSIKERFPNRTDSNSLSLLVFN